MRVFVASATAAAGFLHEGGQAHAKHDPESGSEGDEHDFNHGCNGPRRGTLVAAPGGESGPVWKAGVSFHTLAGCGSDGRTVRLPAQFAAFF
jgi:hypothetical protein